MRRNHHGFSCIILRRRCVPLGQGRRCWWRKRRTTILGRHFGSNPAHSLSPRTSLPSLSLSLTHTHTLVQPCSSAQEQESSSKAKPKSFSHIKRERQFITERESLKNSWSFFRVLQRERSSVWVWESVNLIMVLIRLLRRGMRWFELQKHPDRWIDSVIVRSGARCGPHVWHVSFSMFELSSVVHHWRMKWRHLGLSRRLLFRMSRTVRLGFEFLNLNSKFKRSLDLSLVT